MNFPPELQAKQYVAVVANGHGWRFRVLTTGSARHYLFQALDVGPPDPFPVLKADLQPEIRRMLARGCGNAHE